MSQPTEELCQVNDAILSCLKRIAECKTELQLQEDALSKLKAKRDGMVKHPMCKCGKEKAKATCFICKELIGKCCVGFRNKEDGFASHGWQCTPKDSK